MIPYEKVIYFNYTNSTSELLAPHGKTSKNAFRKFYLAYILLLLFFIFFIDLDNDIILKYSKGLIYVLLLFPLILYT